VGWPKKHDDQETAELHEQYAEAQRLRAKIDVLQDAQSRLATGLTGGEEGWEQPPEIGALASRLRRTGDIVDERLQISNILLQLAQYLTSVGFRSGDNTFLTELPGMPVGPDRQLPCHLTINKDDLTAAAARLRCVSTSLRQPRHEFTEQHLPRAWRDPRRRSGPSVAG
jgi:hypothetical protein